MERGQTIIDFGVGASVFLLTLLLIITFSSSLFVPFQGSQSDTTQTTRVAQALTQQYLLNADRPEPYVIDEECAAYIFDNSSDSPSGVEYPWVGCQFNKNNGTFKNITPVATSDEGITKLNVTIQNQTTGDIVELEGVDGTNKKAEYSDSPLPNDRNTVSVARRGVYIGGSNGNSGETYYLYVRIWK